MCSGIQMPEHILPVYHIVKPSLYSAPFSGGFHERQPKTRFYERLAFPFRSFSCSFYDKKEHLFAARKDKTAYLHHKQNRPISSKKKGIFTFSTPFALSRRIESPHP